MDRFQPSNSRFSGVDPRLVELTYELTQLLESGQTFDLESFVGQHPQHADELRRLYPAIRAMVALAGADNQHLQGHMPPQEHSTEPLGDFQLIRPIGQGGMGVVYEAEQMSLARRVALKILPFASLWTESALERFRNEVRIAAMLEHPNIVPIYGMGYERGVYFYAMKMVDGCSLSDVIGQRKHRVAEHSAESQTLDPTLGSADDTVVAVTTAVMGDDNWYRTVARLGQAVAKALAFAHEQGVIHRDIKPSNLLLDRQGKLFVADFGLARLETDVSLTRTGDLLGTPRYMSPEQASGSSKQFDPRTDIYSLGATLYELLTLRPVISGPSRAAAIRELQDLQVAAPRTHDANIPLALEQIVLKCLQPDPSDRYATAGALAEDLGRYLAGQTVLARAPGVVRRTSRWIQRHPQATLGMLTVLVLFSSISTVSFWMTHQDWFGTSAQRGPPGGEFVETDKLTTIPADFQSPEESPDMLRSTEAKRNASRTALRLESLEQRNMFSVNPLTFLDRFVAEGSGGLAASQGLAFGPDISGDGIQELYVSSAETDSIMRYNGATGSPLPAFGKTGADFVLPGSGGLDAPGDLAFGPDGKLYVSSSLSLQVIRYDTSGNNPEVVVSGLTPQPQVPGSPFGLTFDSYGNLFIANEGADQILRYDGSNTTVFISPGNGLDRPRHAVFGPDGNLYVNSINSLGGGAVLRYNGSTGAFIGSFATTANASTSGGPAWIEFGGDGYLYATVRTTSVPHEKSIVRFDAATGAFVDRFDFSRDGWSFALKTDPVAGVVVYSSTNGHGGFVERFISSRAPDTTKFYVVDDGSTVSQTFEYSSGNGTPRESYSLDNNNSSPRGASVSGFTTLVLDANKNVYVYNPSGTAMGSWSAGGLPSTAQVEGIAVNHKDVWMVDARQDRVFRFVDAAWRMSGSVTAVSSFPLTGANKNPKDLVTDGKYIWILDDAKSDKVFKYTTNGAYLGSWTISTTGVANPTGITLDRGSPDHLWIVDAGTDHVYQYDNATSLIAGSLPASASFPLALRNMNPQGIADPRVPEAGWESAMSSSITPNARLLNFAWVPPLPPSGTIRDNLFSQVASTRDDLNNFTWIEDLVASLQVDQRPTEFMAQRPTSLSSRPRYTEDQSIDLALADEELNNSLHAIANDLLESTLR